MEMLKPLGWKPDNLLSQQLFKTEEVEIIYPIEKAAGIWAGKMELPELEFESSV